MILRTDSAASLLKAKSENPVEMSSCFLKRDGKESDSGSACVYIQDGVNAQKQIPAAAATQYPGCVGIPLPSLLHLVCVP